MGRGNFDVNAYKSQAAEAKQSSNSGFTSTNVFEEFNPFHVKTRYSKKSAFNEFRDPITVLIGLDVTGSMDVIPKSLLSGKLGSLMVDLKKTFNRPNENLQISFAGIGDAKTDRGPLQVTHFESDNRFAQQLQRIWLEGGGGGNGGESYNLLWWYAANRTHLNYVEQDGRKGILITIGDDDVHPNLTAGEIQMWLDNTYDGQDLSNQVLLKAVREQYEIYHIIVTDGSAYKGNKKKWTDLLGENNIILTKSGDVADAIAKIVAQHRPVQRVGMLNLSDEAWSKMNKENLTDQQWIEVLTYSLCPLTHKFMEHPVTWGTSKRAFEKQAVERYVREQQKDPLTQARIKLSDITLKPNLNIAQLCEDYRSFFDALPTEKRESLIQSALLEQASSSDTQTVSTTGASASTSITGDTPFFAHKAAANEGNADVPERFQCLISGELMNEPVFTEDGFTFDRKSITKWFEDHSTSPNTGKLVGKKLTTNWALKKEIDEWKEHSVKKDPQQSLKK